MKDFNEVNEKMTIKEIVIKNFNTTSVLDKYNIDYLLMEIFHWKLFRLKMQYHCPI